MRIKKPLTAEEAQKKRNDAIRRKKDPDHKAFVRRIVTVSVSAAAVFAVWMCNYIAPFRTWVPAYRFSARGADELRVHFIDVGQGDATLFEFPEGDSILIDTGDGSFGNEDHLLRYLKGVAPKSLSVVLTHTDYDHSGGLSHLLEYYPPDAIFFPAVGDFSCYQTADIPVDYLSRYDVLTGSGGAYAVCLSPYSTEEKTDNDVSVALYLRYQNTSFFLGGDISSVRERRLLREYALDETLFDSGDYTVRLGGVDILKASHHGSSYSSAEEWLSLLSPEIAVISCGADNAYGHPASEAVARLGRHADIYRTDELGDIVISVTAEGYSVMTKEDLWIS